MHPITVRELAAVIVESLGLEGVDPEQIDPAAPLFGEGLGLDSLDMLEISLVIQQRWGVKLRSDDLDNEAVFSSLQSLAARIEAQRSDRSATPIAAAPSLPPR